jgi:hypothetical protein
MPQLAHPAVPICPFPTRWKMSFEKKIEVIQSAASGQELTMVMSAPSLNLAGFKPSGSFKKKTPDAWIGSAVLSAWEHCLTLSTT